MLRRGVHKFKNLSGKTKIFFLISVSLVVFISMGFLLRAPTVRALTTPINFQIDVNCDGVGEAGVGQKVTTGFVTRPCFVWSSTGSPQVNWDVYVSFKSYRAPQDWDSQYPLGLSGTGAPPWSDISDTDNGTGARRIRFMQACSAPIVSCDPIVGVPSRGRTFNSNADIAYKLTDFYGTKLRLWDGSVWSSWVDGPDFAINNLPSPIPATGISAANSATTANQYVNYAASTTRLVSVSTAAGLQAALDAALPGDRIELAAGTYTQANGFHINNRSGTQSNPITLTSAAGQTARLDASSGSISVLDTHQSQYWVLSGFEVGNQNAAWGVYYHTSQNIVIEKIGIQQQVTSVMDALIAGISGAKEILIKDIVIGEGAYPLDTGVTIIDSSGAQGLTIRNITVANINTSLNSGVEGILELHNNDENVSLEYSKFYNFTGSCTSRCYVHLYRQTRGSRVHHNVFYKMQRPLVLQDSGNITVDHNVFDQTISHGIDDSTGGYNKIHHNIFTRITDKALSGMTSGVSTNVIQYNDFFQNIGPLPSGLDATNKFGATAVDPLFVDWNNATLGARDYHLTSGSPMRDAGDPVYPAIPVGGGSRVDIGAYEYGAGSWPYTFQPTATVTDATPQISWTFLDHDNTLVFIPATSNTQSRYQIQIDASSTFDSGGPWRPYIDSGTITSGATSYIIPDDKPLVSGQPYYVRVRTSDNIQSPLWGMWSYADYAIQFNGAVAGTYHVRSNGSDTGCNGTLNADYPGSGTGVNCAFQTIQKGVDTMTAGNTLLVHNGTYGGYAPGACSPTNQAVCRYNLNIGGTVHLVTVYNKDVTSPGNAGARYTIKAASGETPILDGNVSGQPLDTAFYVINSSYVTLEGFDIRGFTANSQITGPRIRYGVLIVDSDSSNVEVLGNTISGTDPTLNPVLNPSDSGSEINIHAAPSAKVEGNTITTHLFYAIGNSNLITTNITTSNNEIMNNVITQTLDGSRATPSALRAISAIRNNGVQIKNNFLQNTDPQKLDGSTPMYIRDESGVVIQGNFISGYGTGIYLQDEAAPAGIGNEDEQHVVSNNTIDVPSTANSVGIVTGGSAQSCDGCVLKNNLIIGANEGIKMSSMNSSTYPSVTTVTHNMFRNVTIMTSVSPAGEFSLSNNVAAGTNPITASGFKPTPYYELVAGSPAIDAGDNAYCGISNSGTCEIGAYEFSGGGPPPNVIPATVTGADQSPIAGQSFFLSGTASDSDGTIAAASPGWSISPSGCTLTASSTTGIGTASVVFNATATCATANTYTATLTVNDDDGATNDTTNTNAFVFLFVSNPAGTHTLVLQEGGGTLDGVPLSPAYIGTKDNRILIDPSPPLPENGNGGAIQTHYVGTGSGTEDQRLLLAFDLREATSSLPATAQIQSAILELNLTFNQVNTDNPIAIYSLLRNWGEGVGTTPFTTTASNGESTWVSATHNITLWTTPGASSTVTDRNGTVIGARTILPSESLGAKTWVLQPATVQGWVTTPTTNYGMILIGREDTTQNQRSQFASREHTTQANRPKLTITYTTGAGDTTVPAAVTNLAATTSTTSTVTLTWTATGDDGSTGTATSYDVRYATSSITTGNWTSATQTTGEPTPQIVGSSETMTVSGLTASTTYYFALKALDEANNSSTLSNVPSRNTTSGGGGGCGDAPLPGSPEGFGSGTTGGAGQREICVTNLNDSGTGSFRAAIADAATTNGNAKIHFGVGGTITLASDLNLYSLQNVTIDGSTARSLGGLTLRGYTLQARSATPTSTSANPRNIIFQHLRHEGTGITNKPAFSIWCTGIGSCDRIWFDHLTAQWATDDPLLFYEGVTDATMSYSLVYNQTGTTLSSKALNVSGVTIGKISDRVTLHRNVLTTNAERHPQVMGSATVVDTKPLVDIRNNIVHNWVAGSIPTGNYGIRFRRSGRGNVVKNVFFSTNRPNNALEIGTAGDTVSPGPVYTSGNDAQQANINTIGTTSTVVGSPPAIAELTTQEMRRPRGTPGNPNNVLLDMNLLTGTGVGAFPRTATDEDALNGVEADIAVTSDTTPPTVSFITPVNATTVAGIVTITASSSDAGSGMSGVIIKYPTASGTSSISLPGVGPLYSTAWDTTGLSNGSYALVVEATDAAPIANTASTSIVVTVNNIGGGPSGTPTPPPPITTATSISLSDGGTTGAYEVGATDVIPDSLGFCPTGMVWVPAPGNFCMDKYEYENIGNGQPYSMTLVQAQVACDARQVFQGSGGPTLKARLPLAYEWWLAALGTPDTTTCNTTSGTTGSVTSTPSCMSRSGVQNMIGNVEEWVNDAASGLPTGYVIATNVQGIPTGIEISLSASTALYGDDYVTGGSGSMARGGKTGDGTWAGLYAIAVNPASAGFRCAVK